MEIPDSEDGESEEGDRENDEAEVPDSEDGERRDQRRRRHLGEGRGGRKGCLVSGKAYVERLVLRLRLPSIYSGVIVHTHRSNSIFFTVK